MLIAIHHALTLSTISSEWPLMALSDFYQRKVHKVYSETCLFPTGVLNMSLVDDHTRRNQFSQIATKFVVYLYVGIDRHPIDTTWHLLFSGVAVYCNLKTRIGTRLHKRQSAFVATRTRTQSKIVGERRVLCVAII